MLHHSRWDRILSDVDRINSTPIPFSLTSGQIVALNGIFEREIETFSLNDI